MSERPTLRRRLAPLGKAFWWVIIALLFGPFALLYASAFVGLDITDNVGVGRWLMFSLTVCGLVGAISELVSWFKGGRFDWFFFVILAGATVLFGWLALEPFR